MRLPHGSARTMRLVFQHRAATVLLLFFTFTLTACGPNVVNMQVHDEFPVALVEPLPIAVAVYYPPEFTAYVHKEKRPGKSGAEWEINNLGELQTKAFRSVFHSAFREVRELAQPAGAPAGV